MDKFELQSWLQELLEAGELDRAVLELEEKLLELSNSPFQEILRLKFTNSPQAIADVIDRFIERESDRFKVEAVYTETNGFAYNPNCWWFSFFAYQKYGGLEDHDWLSGWNSLDRDDELLQLTGMESLQRIYQNLMDGEFDSPAEKSGALWDEARVLCTLLVVCRFQLLIREAAQHCLRL